MEQTKQDRKRIYIRAACFAVIQHAQSCNASNAQIASLVGKIHDFKSSEASKIHRKRQRGYNNRVFWENQTNGVIKSFWRNVKKSGDALEFLHFTSLTRNSFNDLNIIMRGYIEKMQQLCFLKSRKIKSTLVELN